MYQCLKYLVYLFKTENMLKGQFHETFWSTFLHQSAPSELASSISQASQNSQSYLNFNIFPVEFHNAALKNFVR